MWHGQCNFLPYDKLNIHTKEGVFLSCGTPHISNFFSILSSIIGLTLSSIWKTLLSSTNHQMVHWFSFTILFETQCLYGLVLKPKSDNVVDNSSYYNRASSILPWVYFKIRTYSTFFPLLYVTIFCKLMVVGVVFLTVCSDRLFFAHF